MKKLPLLLSLILTAALLLAACGGNANNGATPVPVDPAVPAEETLDPVVPEEPVVEPTQTVIIEEPVVEETPTEVAMEETPVAEATEEAVPVTGDAGDYCYPNRLTHIIGSNLVDQNGVLIGEVEGVIVNRGTVTLMAEDSFEGATETPADDADVTDDAVATDEAGLTVDPAMQAADGPAPKVMYLLVDIADDTDLFEDDRDVMIPFGGLQAETERQPLDVQDNCVFTMTQDIQILVDAPYFEDNLWEDELDLSLPDWDLEYNTYWNEQGVMVEQDMAGESMDVKTASSDVLLRDGFSINVRNLEDENLGEITEFILNLESGDFTHGILSRGGFLGLGSNFYPVPMEQLSWVHFTDDATSVVEDDQAFDLDNLGEFLLDINEEEFENVEGFDDLDEIDFFTPDWSVDYDAYWMNRVPVEEGTNE